MGVENEVAEIRGVLRNCELFTPWGLARSLENRMRGARFAVRGADGPAARSAAFRNKNVLPNLLLINLRAG